MHCCCCARLFIYAATALGIVAAGLPTGLLIERHGLTRRLAGRGLGMRRAAG